ncbi:MAG: hypothetical protein ABJB12_17210 [Pseudomonadota bacterium]
MKTPKRVLCKIFASATRVESHRAPNREGRMARDRIGAQLFNAPAATQAL